MLRKGNSALRLSKTGRPMLAGLQGLPWLILLIVFLVIPFAAEAAPRSKDPVLLQARKDLSARKPEIAMAALEALLAKDVDAQTRSEATLVLAQAYLDRAAAFSRAKDDSGASAVYDKAIALLEPFVLAMKDRKTKDSADSLLSKAYMSNADANIRLKNYDKALLALQSFTTKNPERFDQANSKVRRIFAIREEYTKLAGEIRDKALSSAGNDPAISGMIEKLRNLDPYANKDTLNVLLEVRTRIANLDLLRKTMSAAKSLADAGDRAGALGAYVSGFAPDSKLPALYWQELVNAGFDILEVRDAQTGEVLIAGPDGIPRLVIVDGTGRVIRTDSQDRPTKGPGGFVYSTDAKGAVETVTFHDFGGQRQVDPAFSPVAQLRDFAEGAAAFAQGIGAKDGHSAVFGDVYDRLRLAFSASNGQSIAGILPSAEKAFDDLDGDRKGILSDSDRLVSIFKALPLKHADGRDRSILDWSWTSYADFFLKGRPPVTDYAARDQKTDPLWRPEGERGKAEGIAGLLFSQESTALAAAQDAADASVATAWNGAQAAWSQGSWADAKAGFDESTSLLSPERAIVGFWSPLLSPPSVAGLPPELVAALTPRQSALAAVEARIGLSPSLSRIAEIRASIDDLGRRLAAFPAPGATTTVLASSYQALAGLRQEARGYEEALAREGTLTDTFRGSAQAATSSLTSFSLPSQGPGDDEKDWENKLSASLDAARRGESAVVALSTSYEIGGLERELADRGAAIDAAAALAAGSPSTVPARKGFVDPSPSGAALALAAEQAKIAALAKSLADLGSRLGAETPWVKADAGVTAVAARDSAASKAVALLETRRASLLADALAKKATAATALSAAQKSFASADASLAAATREMLAVAQRPAARRDLDAATTSREAGYARFLDAMNGDFDRATWDAGSKRYDDIGRAINDARDQYAKLEVDRLLADAQHSYDIGNFDASFESLTNANTLWKERYSGVKYPPLDFWLNLVRLARDTGNTRVIRPNDPLYNEMTQYLSLARMSYEDAINLQKAGKGPEAKKTFAKAADFVANVTRTFPLNADAGFLNLQILKATNEADFKASLPGRIDDAAAQLKLDPAKGYASIADLARIEPTNTRLANLLIQAEIATGKRKPAPTAAQRTQAQQLTDQARQLIKTGRQTDLAQAEKLVTQALGLDPNNRDAQSLSLNIQTLRGVGPDLVLGVEDARRLADARLYFSQGQYNQARDTLNVLLANNATRSRDVLLLDQQLNQLNY